MRFVIVVDMQRDFVARNGALPVADAESIVGPMAKWLAALSPRDTAGVLFTADTHIPETYATSEEAREFPAHCVAGTPGWALMVEPATVDSAIPCYTLTKGVFDMWAEPGLEVERIDTGRSIDRDAFFANLRNAGITEVRVIGVAADYCVRWAIEGLAARGFQVTVPAALTRGITRQIEQVADEEWAGCAVTITTST